MTGFEAGAPSDPASHIAAFKERLEILSALVSHPGWALLDATLKVDEQSEYQAMMSAPDAHGMAKHAGAFNALHNLRTWPQREADACRMQLADLQLVAPSAP